MRYNPISNDLFIHNRINFSELMKPNSMAIFNSNDIMPTNADGVMPFKQNSDLYYLSGIDQEETTLIIIKDADNTIQTHLYLRETNDHIAIWEGPKLSKEKATLLSGINSIYWNQTIESDLIKLIPKYETIYFNSNEHLRAENLVETRDDRFWKNIKKEIKVDRLEKAAPLMHKLRQIKHPLELEMISKACKITESAFRRVLKFTKPDLYEYQIEAEIIHEFISNGSRGHAYQPIIASGKNACVLHYIENHEQCRAGDLILMDFGAEYGCYNSDLTRTIPVNGKYTQRQADVYNAVLRVMKEAKSMLVPGNNSENYNKEIGALMTSELIGLGLLDKNDVSKEDKKAPLYKQYFMHGTSHSLGLDVHDVDDRSREFENGMVFTCEPGIYIPKENLGIRLENNLVIQDNSPLDLMANIPIEIEEIEDLMNN